MSLIVLLTDFGHQDPYVGIVKGVILGICPQARIVDLVHELPAGDIRRGAWQLWSARAYFAPGTIFVGVVDPGVGSSRRAIALRAQDRFYVGPDNGLLGWAADPITAAVVLDRPQWHLPRPGRTFHGRDLFAPVAAHLAAGVPLAELGSAVAPASVIRLDWPPVRQQDGIRGEILLWDRFGNLISNLPESAITALGPNVIFEIGPWRIQGLSRCYSDVPPGRPLALIGSSGLLEISLAQGDARQALAAEPGLGIRVFAGAT